MDLLIITPGFPANEADTSCVPPLQEYLLALRKSRPQLRVAVIALHYPYTSSEYSWKGIPVFPCNGRNRKWMRGITHWRAMRALGRVDSRGALKAVHALWLGEAAVLGQRMASEAGARMVITLMGQDARDGRRWWERLKPGAAMVALTSFQQQVYERTFSEQIAAVIPWGVPVTAAASVANRSIDLLFCGSLIAVKRPLQFVEVVDQVRRMRNVKALMLGSGPLEAQVRAAITQKGLGDIIEVRGQVARERVLAAMHDSRVLVHPSEFEGQGYVFDEALSNGMQVTSYAVGSARHMDRWRIANDPTELAVHASDLLQAPHVPSPLVIHPVEDTVEAYLELYGLS